MSQPTCEEQPTVKRPVLVVDAETIMLALTPHLLTVLDDVQLDSDDDASSVALV